jgi:hypothetical protein
VAQQWFDALGASLYIACIALETGIFVSQGIWLWRVRHVRKEAKLRGLSYDEFVQMFPEKGRGESVSGESVVEGDLEACRGKETNEKTLQCEKQEVANDNGAAASGLEAGLQLPPAALIKR